MIHDLDKTLENVLYNKGNLSRTDIDVAFDTPDREWSSRLSRPTISCWAFDLRENMKLRSLERSINRNGNMTTTTYPSIRIDITYLVTAWARKMEDEHQLLWRAMSALKNTPIMKPSETEGDLRYARKDIALLVATPSDHPVNLVDLWGVVDNVMHMGFTAVATLELDILPSFEAPLVLEQHLRVGQSPDPTTQKSVAMDSDIIIAIAPESTDEPDNSGDTPSSRSFRRKR
jgi:hypothetical protein